MSTTDSAVEQDLDRTLAAAAAAAPEWARRTPAERADALTAVADALDAASPALVPIAIAETGLAEGRLTGEVTRTTVQLRMFADLLRDGSYLRVQVDEPDPDFVLGARPDLRRVLLPIGPVLVFAASNFPFAFSVAGGDTASALAAGCPVVLKAHPGHPETSLRTAEIVRAALDAAGAPDGTFAMITGVADGRRALEDPRIEAAAFTGSVAGGRALFDVAAARPKPIPFFGELGSINPVVVTEEAERERGADIATGFTGSFTLGAGQFCTKPGILLVPAGSALPARIAELAAEVPAARVLTGKIADGYRQRLDEVTALDGVEVLLRGDEQRTESGVPAFAPSLLHAGAASNLLDRDAVLLEETFGPTAVIAEYASDEELRQVLAAIDGSLTATVQTSGDPGPAERDPLLPIVELVAARAGRVVFDQWPTGVAVTAAQQHGGPYPATTAPAHTSVGTAAIDRFLRPVAFQNAPDSLLPPLLQAANPLGVPRAG
ncbi:aldehyde dehydrogenase (NADP(+)) [Saccharopolyspora sp. NPDC047091]|uniref:aldehyde dehydrogenase (NADP(+)) n=1 Tax=Saccharopolyspora sp. NPDC047091 TaxID=3155924 RepID=UPI0033CE44BB